MQRPSTGRPRNVALFIAAGVLWIALNVVYALIGLAIGLGDSPVTGTSNVTLTAALWSSGTIVSPPLVFMLPAVVLLAAGASRQLWLSRIGTALLVVGVAFVGYDTAGGLHTTAPHYGSTRWDVVLVLGWLFVLTCVLVVFAGMNRLAVRERS